MSSSSPILVASGVTKKFQRHGLASIDVLSAVSMEVFAGDSIAIVGKSGAGKSTLLHILGTLEEPSAGKVFFLGQDVFKFKETALSKFRNRSLGFVFQFHYLMLEFSALENVMMPALIANLSKQEAEEKAERLLIKVGLKDRLTHKPNRLSGGEQQRVSIARALMMNPKLLFTDEMTGNLDPLTGASVFELVQGLHAEYNIALISVTHDETLAATYQRIYRLGDGKLVEEH